MSWDVMIFDFGGDPKPIDQMTEDDSPRVMGTPAEVRAQIDAHLPGVDWSDPTWGFYDGSGFSFEFHMGEEELKDSFMVHVHDGDGDATGPLIQFAKPNNWSLIDCSTKEFIDSDNPPQVSWEALQAFRDVAIDKDNGDNYAITTMSEYKQKLPADVGRDSWRSIRWWLIVICISVSLGLLIYWWPFGFWRLVLFFSTLPFLAVVVHDHWWRPRLFVRQGVKVRGVVAKELKKIVDSDGEIISLKTYYINYDSTDGSHTLIKTVPYEIFALKYKVGEKVFVYYLPWDPDDAMLLDDC